MNDNLKFLTLSDADLNAWRGSPVSIAFFEWIVAEAANTKEDIVKNVANGKNENARILAGRLMALDAILRSCDNPAPLPVLSPDEDWNPNARPAPGTQIQKAKVSDDLQAE